MIKIANGIMVKESMIPAWGGRVYQAPITDDISAELGYGWGLGAIPMPKIGIRGGDEKGGLSIGSGYLGIDSGREPGKGIRTSKMRNVYELAYDMLKGKKADNPA